MQILSTRNRPGFADPSRDKLTAIGQLDRQLAEGNPVPDVVDLGSRRAEAGKSEVYRDFGFTALHHGVFGGAFGLATTDMSPVGALVGLGLGTYVAWNKTARKNSGTVTLEMDGQTRKTRYYGGTKNYLKTPQEKRVEMLARGQLGERITPFTPEAVDGPATSFTTGQRSSLESLAKERRLAADFGQRSKYGYEVLNAVDSLTAARLMEAGKNVFLVDGKSKDVTHTLDVVASNNRSTVRRHESDSYLERTYDYTLSPLSRDSLEAHPEGQGLPESFHGVYKNHKSCALVVGEDQQAGFGASGKDWRKSDFDFRRVTRDQDIDLGSKDKARVVSKVSVNVRDLVMMSGILAGLMGGMYVAPGVPSAALIGAVTGGVAGREVGWLVQDRMPGFERA